MGLGREELTGKRIKYQLNFAFQDKRTSRRVWQSSKKGTAGSVNQREVSGEDCLEQSKIIAICSFSREREGAEGKEVTGEEDEKTEAAGWAPSSSSAPPPPPPPPPPPISLSSGKAPAG